MIPEGLTKYKVEDNVEYHGQGMLHYLGRRVGEEAVFGVGSNGEITRERLRQLATARLAEQERVMQEASFLFQREAVAMQQKVNVTVASKPLYPIGAPQRIRMPKQPVGRFADPLLRHPPYDGPLNLVNRPVVSGHHSYGVVHQSLDGPADLSKPLDLSMKSDRLVAVSRAPKSVVDPRMMSIANAEMIAKQSFTVCTNGNEVTSKVTSAQTMYRPPPMMSYGKPGRHGNGIHHNPSAHRQHSHVTKDISMSQGQLHPLVSAGGVGPHIQPHRIALKRPAPVMARSASDIPLKRTVHESTLGTGLAKERLQIASSSSVPTSVNMQTYHQSSSRTALLAFERERNHGVALINQQSRDSQLRITDVRSIGSRGGASLPPQAPTSTQSRPRSNKTTSASVFHHIHHHHHHHHVPQPDKELLRSNSNGTAGVHGHAGVHAHVGVLAQAGGAGPGNGLLTRDIPVHRLTTHVMPAHDVPPHGMAAPGMAAPSMAAPNMSSSRGDRMHGVLIKHTSTPVSTMTSPHLRRAHYQTRRRKRSSSPPTLDSISGVNPLRLDPVSVGTTPGRAHQHTRAVSPLKLVASSIAAGAKMNELLKPLDGPEQPTACGHSGANNNNNKVHITDKLARPLSVDIPDDRAFVSHLGGVYTGQANPVPLVRQVSNAANITKCLTSEANSSPKKSNSSGNESPTMPVLTPQSVYSPCFATESSTNLTHMSSSMEPPPASSPMFYNALTLPLYPRKQEVPAEAVQKVSRAKDESPPNLNETSPEQLVPDQRVPGHIDPEMMTGPDRRAERIRVESVLHRQIDSYIAAAVVDKNKRDRRCLRETLSQDRPAAYPRFINTDYHREVLEKRDKPRRRHMHSHGLKASMEKIKVHHSDRVKERSHLVGNHDDRNIFAELMLQSRWCEDKTSTNETTAVHTRKLQQVDVIDLTTSPSSSPAPTALGSIASRNGGSGGISKKTPETSTFSVRRNTNIRSAIEDGRTFSVSEAIEAVLAAQMPETSSSSPSIEQRHRDATSEKFDLEGQELLRVPQKDQPPKLVKVQASPLVSSSAAPPVVNACAVITSAKSSSVLPPITTTPDVSKAEASLVDSYTPLPSAHQAAPFLVESPSVETSQLTNALAEASQPPFFANSQGTLSMASSTSSLPHPLRYSPTEKTFSHDPRKKLLAAMSVQTPTVTACAISPASIAASLSSTVSPSSGRSTPSKNSARKRSLEISRLENTSSYVAEIPKRRQNVDLLTDPALLDREERALQRAMKRFNEMEKREKVTPNDAQTEPPTDPHPNGKRSHRLIFSKNSPLFRRGRGRGRKFLGCQRSHQTQKGDPLVFPGSHRRQRRGFSREMHRLTSHGGRSSFQDFVPLVLEERTRHSLATRSSARERKVYHKNARYEMEIEKEERKFLERKRQKRSLSGSTSGEDEPPASRTKTTTGRRRRGAEDVLKKSSDACSAAKEQLPVPKGKSDPSESATPGTQSGGDAPENPAANEGVARSPSMDAPLHVVIDPTNHTKMKFMTSSAYELHRKDSGKENKDGDREEMAVKPGGKRKFKTKHLGPASLTVDPSGRQDDKVTIKTEVLDSVSAISPPEPSPVKVVRPSAPVEMKRLMVNKKLGETVLHRAARLAYDDVAIYCIDYDVVNINAKDNAGYTPLHECCVHGRLRVASHLLKHGADVNASASDGTRPIHDAVDNNWLALVRLLLTYGADPLIATYSGRTTIKLARTTAMKTFIIGYLSDINGKWELDEEDPYQNNLDLRWYLTGTHSFDANDLAVSDIFQDVSEGEKKASEGEFLFEVSDTPHLTSYNIRLPNEQRARNWLLLPDVTKQLSTSRTEFLACNRTLRRATMTTDEFNAAIKSSQLNCVPPERSQMMLDEVSGGYIVEMLELTSELRKTLSIDEEYV